MNDESPSPPEAPTRPARSRRRKSGSRRGLRVLVWLGAGMIVLGIAGALSLRLWVNRYLRSDAFTQQLNDAAGRTLHAECRIGELTWQDPVIYGGTFEAHGREAAAFQRLKVSDVRAELDTNAVWDKVWRVKQVKVAMASLDFSSQDRLPDQPAGSAAADSAAPAEGAGGWRQRWLPNRTEIGPVRVDRFDFSKAATLGLAALTGEGVALDLEPNLKMGTVGVSGRGGEVKLANVKSPMKLDRLRGTVKKEGASLDFLSAKLEGAEVTAEGTVEFAAPGAMRLQVRATDAALAKWLPEDWLRRCDGTASLRADLRGDWTQPNAIRAEGNFTVRNGFLQALPMLDIIAKKTQNASFLRLQLKEVTGNFERLRTGDWQLRKGRADAPGLLRLKGDVEVRQGGALQGTLLLGIVPGTLRYLAGAEQTVFIPANAFSAVAGQAGLLEADDAGLLWTRFRLGGTLDSPEEDLSERLAQAWFNATVDEVAALSMEAASTAARTAASAADTVLEVAPTLLDKAPPILEKAPDLLEKGVQGGLKVLDGLLPR